MKELSISKMSGKLSGIQAINTNPLMNNYCRRMSKTDTVCKHCYSRKMLQTYRKSCAASWTKNGDILKNHIIKDEDIPRFNTEWVRFHGHGELFNIIHYVNLIKIAQKNPQNTFALWTKRKEIVGDMILNPVRPENLILVYSNPSMTEVLREPPEGFDKVFNVVGKDSTESINCGGKKCTECGFCYNKNNGKDCIMEMVK